MGNRPLHFCHTGTFISFFA